MTSIVSVLPAAPDWATIMLITSLITPPCRSIIPTCHGASVGTTSEVAEYLSASVRNAARKEVPMSVTGLRWSSPDDPPTPELLRALLG